MNKMERIKIDWFFGIPGSGKTHIARQLSQMTGIPMYDGDDFHTNDDRRAVAQGIFTLERRHAQLKRISTKLRTAGTPHALVTHPLPDRESRALVRRLSTGDVRLIHVTAPLDLIKERLRARKDHHFWSDLLDAWISKHWQEPCGENCLVIENGLDNQLLEDQLRKFGPSD